MNGLNRVLTERFIKDRLAHLQEFLRNSPSGELNDETAQTLVGINVRLLTLKREAILNTKRLKKDIINTQRLVNQSARNLLRVARELGIRHEA